MANMFDGVTVSRIETTGQLTRKCDFPVTICVEYDPQGITVNGFRGKPKAHTDALCLHCLCISDNVYIL